MRPFFRNKINSMIIIVVLSVMIFWQTILVLIVPFRFNVFILLIEICLFFYFIFRTIRPY